MTGMIKPRGKTPRRAAPESEFIKRARVAPEPVKAQQAVTGKPMSKVAAKAAVESERQELLKGLDAVMTDLQQRADEKRGQVNREKEEKKRVSSKQVSATRG